MPDPYLQRDGVTLYAGDCLDVLRELPDASVDAVVTDPPYGLEFMGKEWDSFSDGTATSRATAGMMSGGISAAHGRPSFMGGINPKCRTCDRWQRGANPCHCDAPDFPNERRARSAAFGAWCELWAAECLRVLKPGGHLLAFGGTRTWHRLACAIEDAGFEIRDSIAWLYGSGFPKSHDVSKAIDRAAGAERPVLDTIPDRWAGKGSVLQRAMQAEAESVDIIGPATPDAERWQGWGTALKPSHESIVVARKPLIGTVAQNVLTYGTGALNIRATQIGSQLDSAGSSPGDSSACTCPSPVGDRTSHTQSRTRPASSVDSPERHNDPLTSASEHVLSYPQPPSSPAGCLSSSGSDGEHAQSAGAGGLASAPRPVDAPGPHGPHASAPNTPVSQPTPCPKCTAPNVERTGRWPANVVLDEAQADALDQQSGPVGSNSGDPRKSDGSRNGGGIYSPGVTASDQVWETRGGGASRFMYVAKASTAERPRYWSHDCDCPHDRPMPAHGVCDVCGTPGKLTAHATVKPLALMRWLVRLVTPPGGTVLEPFSGSGTTIEACLIEGYRCVAIEKEADYLPLIESRIARQRDPVRAVELAGADAGLFEFITDGEVS